MTNLRCLSRLKYPLLLLSLWLVSALVYFRAFVFSGFDKIAGDIGDVRFDIFIRENFFQFLSGHSEFLSPPMFYPIKGTLGYSDAYLLDALIYVPTRILGADPFISFELVCIVGSLIGFLTFNLLVTRYLKARQPWAAISAVLFTFSNALYIKIGHPQMQEVYVTPVIIWFGLEAARLMSNNLKHARLLATGSGLLFALLCSTGFYVAWFFVFLVGATVTVGAVLTCGKSFQRYASLLRRYIPVVIYWLAGFLIGSIIFWAIYGDMLALHRGRSLQEYLATAPGLVDLFNVGRDNVVWGALLAKVFPTLQGRLDNGELTLATSPGMSIFYAILMLGILRKRLVNGTEDATRRTYLIAAAFAYGALLLTVIQIHGVTLYGVAMHILPGASAIRNGARAWIVTNGIVASTIAVGLTHLSTRMQSGRDRLLLLALTAFLLIEQIDLHKNHSLSRQTENQWMERISLPPAHCRSFYLIPEDGHRDSPVQQIDGIMIAQKTHLPTLNGYSGWMPPDWHMERVRNVDYFTKVLEWVQLNQLADGLCSYDVATSRWGGDDLQGQVQAISESATSLTPGLSVHMKDGGDGLAFLGSGWANAEADGVWTDGAAAILVGSVKDWPSDDMIVHLVARPFVVATKHPSISVAVLANGQQVDQWTFNADADSGTVNRSVRIPKAVIASAKVLKVEFKIDTPAVPKDLGVHPTDDRHLGLFVKQISFQDSHGTALTSSGALINPGMNVVTKEGGDGIGLLGAGWARPESDGVWSDGPTATITGITKDWPTNDMIVHMTMHPFLVPAKHPAVTINVVANGQTIDAWLLNAAVDSGIVDRSVRIPHAVITASQFLNLELHIDAPAVPKDLGVHPTDDRHLGVFLRQLSFEAAQ